MLAWLVDNANVVYLLLGVVVLGLGVSYWLNRRVKTLILAAGVASLIALFWLFTWLMPTDRKQIEANLWAMGRAVLDRRPNDLVKHWAKDFQFEGLNRDDLARAVAVSADKFNVESINLWEFDVKSLTEDKADIWFRCVANAKGGGTFLAICKAKLVKEGEAWRLKDVGFYQPVANTDQKIAMPIGR